MSSVIRKHRRNNVWIPGYESSTPAQTVIAYDTPPGAPVSNLYSARVGQSQDPMAIYPTSEGHFGNFEMSPGLVEIKVDTSVAITSVTVHPKRFGLIPDFTPGSHSFTLVVYEPHNYVIFVNGNELRPLYIFANPVEEDPPGPQDVTYYYGPGYYNGTYPNGTALPASHRLILQSNQSCYVHPGAYVRGKITLGWATSTRQGPIRSNISLRGYGVVDSTQVSVGDGPGRPTAIDQVSGATIDGLTFLGQTHWGCIITESDGVMLRHMKMINLNVTGGTPDGVDIIGSSNVTYQSCFIRSSDDSIAIKTWKNGYGPSPGWAGNVENIQILDSVIDQGDGGNGVEIGYENFNNTTSVSTPVNDPVTGQPVAFIRNISYRRTDLIRKRRDPAIQYRMAGLGIHLVDDVPLSNVLYEDVNVEYCEGEYWLWVGAFYTGDYSYGSGRAQISDITYRRVTFDGPNQLPIHIQGGGGGQTVHNLVMQDVYIKGVKLANLAPISGKFTWEVSNVSGVNGNSPVFL